MTIAVVGANGIVGTTLVEHFLRLGHEVLSVERNGRPTLEEAAKKADIVFVVTRPIREVGALLERAGLVMPAGTLLIHGTSVESPHGMKVSWDRIARRGVNVCHLHFHFRPQKPLRETLRGQHITLSITGAEAEHWQEWLIDSLAPYQPFIHVLKPNEHDTTTAVSQLVHMITAFLVSKTWQRIPSEILERGVTIGGPPCRSLIRSVLRTATGAPVAAEIVECHPQAEMVLDKMHEALNELEDQVRRSDLDQIKETIGASRQLIPEATLDDWDKRTIQLIRLDADLQRHNVELHFPAEANRIGLLARVLGEFDRRGVDKTTTIAQTNPDGSCTFVIGVREDSPAVAEAVTAIESWKHDN